MGEGVVRKEQLQGFLILALGKWRQEDPWGSPASQLTLISILHASERPVSKWRQKAEHTYTHSWPENVIFLSDCLFIKLIFNPCKV